MALFVSHLLPAPLNGDQKIRNDRCQFGSLRLLSSNRYTTIGKRLLRSVAFVANIDAKECDASSSTTTGTSAKLFAGGRCNQLRKDCNRDEMACINCRMGITSGIACS